MFPSIAFAQLSPGPLSAAHEELEGVKNCLKCHGVKETRVDPHCLDCHGEIARLRADGRGSARFRQAALQHKNDLAVTILRGK